MEYVQYTENHEEIEFFTSENALRLRGLVPFQLVNLEMLFDFDVTRLTSAINRVNKYHQDSQGSETNSESRRDKILELLLDLETFCKFFKIDARDAIVSLRKKVLNPNRYPDSESSYWRELRNTIGKELKKHQFAYIPFYSCHMYRKENYFPPIVVEKFKSAKEDMLNAATCQALGLYTASVFHSMRVLECGLRVMAKDIGVPIKTKRGTSIPLDMQEWGEIINKIEKAIKDKRDNMPKSRAKKNLLQKYSDLAAEFAHFKDAWRNHVMHENTEYDPTKSLEILAHTRTFMKKLSNSIK